MLEGVVAFGLFLRGRLVIARIDVRKMPVFVDIVDHVLVIDDGFVYEAAVLSGAEARLGGFLKCTAAELLRPFAVLSGHILDVGVGLL